MTDRERIEYAVAIAAFEINRIVRLTKVDEESKAEALEQIERHAQRARQSLKHAADRGD